MRILWLMVIVWGCTTLAQARDTLRIFTWDGYVTAHDIKVVNQLLADKGYDITAEVISPYASGPEQAMEAAKSRP